MNKQVTGQQECERLGQEMVNTVDKVEALFRKAESDLEYMSRKLGDEFREQLGDNNQLNPTEMMQRLQRVKKEYNSLVQEAEGIKAMQSQMAAYFRAQLQTACTAIQALQEKAPQAQISDSTEQEGAVQALLGQGTAELTEASEGATTADDSACRRTESQEMSGRENSTTGATTTVASQADKRARSNSFTAISDEEFQSISPLIKGRAKLADVNAVYRSLFDHFKASPKSGQLTVQDMTKLGLRITGATGEAKLKVLRALKILSISKNGAVKLL